MLSDGDLFDKAFDKGATLASNDVAASSIGPTNTFNDILGGSSQTVHRGGAQPRQQSSELNGGQSTVQSQNAQHTEQVEEDQTHFGSGYDAMFRVMLADSKYFKIGETNHEFNDQDPIFTLDRPALRQEHTAEKGACVACNSTFKSLKALSYCEFCGGPVCKSCLVKQRPLPDQDKSSSILKTDSSGEIIVTSPGSQSGPRHHICKVCDRKFYVRELVKASRSTIQDQAAEIEALCRQVEAL